MQFNMNAALKKIQVTCKQESDIPINQAGCEEQLKSASNEGEQGESSENADNLHRSTMTQES